MKRTSALVPLLNTVMRPATARGRGNPDSAFWKLFERAGALAGDHPPLHEDDVDGYRLLLSSFAAAPGLTPLGWAMAVADIKARIANQMRVEALHAARPEIGREQIERPIVVVGLPRTATTLTHKVIAQSAGHRAPALWELMYSSLELSETERRRRIRQIDSAMRFILRLAPAMAAIHPQRAEGPDEDPFALPHGAQHLARASMRGYENWCAMRDHTRDYDYLLQVYQVLQHGRETRRWVIKSPTHLGHLDQIVRIFPDAQIVWLHRDPATVMGSLCSLVETSWRLHVRRPDLHAIGQMALRTLPWMVERARTARVDIPREQIIDIPYHAVANEPGVKIPLLYERLGARWTERDAANLARTMARPTRRVHEYALHRYGLTNDEVEAAFGDYSQAELRLQFT